MPKRTGDFNAWHLEKLSDPTIAAEYLNTVWTDSRDLFLDAVKDVIQARQVSSVAKQVGMKRESLYRSFSSAAGNPTWSTMQAVLGAVGVEFPGLRAVGANSQNSDPPISSGTKKRRGRRRRKGNVSSRQLSLFPLSDVVPIPSVGVGLAAIKQGDYVGFHASGVVNETKLVPEILPGFMLQQQGGARAQSFLS